MRLPHILRPGSLTDPFVVVRSGFWNFNAIGVFDGDEALVIDPGIYPEDIALLGAQVATRGREHLAPRSVRHVVVTHSHHDHIRGWRSFPGAQVTMPAVAANKGELAQSRILAAKAKLDDRLQVHDPDFTYPKPQQTFDTPHTLRVGEIDVVVYPLFGHSNCCSVVWIPALHTLCTGDYLVAPGLPYCRWEATAMESALDWLAQFCEENEVQHIWPAHNAALHGAEAIQAGIHLDRESMRRIRTACREAIASGAEQDEGLATATRVAREWRGTESKAARLQDLDNARRVWAEEIER